MVFMDVSIVGVMIGNFIHEAVLVSLLPSKILCCDVFKCIPYMVLFSFVFYLYPQIAIYGYSFCVATCKVVNLLLRNIVRTVVKDNIVRFLLFLGEICIVVVVGELQLDLYFGGNLYPTCF